MIKIAHMILALVVIFATKSCGIDIHRTHPPVADSDADNASVQQITSTDEFPKSFEPQFDMEELFKQAQEEDDDVIWAEGLEGGFGYIPGVGKSWSGTPWDESPFVREDINRALNALNLEDKYAISDLLDAAGNAGVLVRERAIAVLGLLGPIDERILLAVANAIHDPEQKVRASAARALARIGEDALPYIYEALESDKTETLEAGLHSLRLFVKETGNDIDPEIFVGHLSHMNSYIRDAALKGLAGLGDKALPALPDIIEILEDEYSWNCSTAAKAITNFSDEASDALPLLIRHVYDYTYQMREEVGKAIICIDTGAHKEIRDFNKKMGLGDIFGAEFQYRYITALSLETDEDVRTLIDALKGESLTIRLLAAEILRRAAPDAADAVPALIGVLDDDNEWLRIFAVDAIGAIGAEGANINDAIPELKKIITDKTESHKLRDHARLAVAKNEGVTSLRALLSPDNQWLCIYAAEAINAIGEDAIDVAPDLVALLDDASERIRGAASRALAGIGYYEPRAMDYFITVISDGEFFQIYGAAKSLAKFGSVAVPPVIELLGDSRYKTRRYAAQALGYMEDVAVEAVPALINALNDGNNTVVSNSAKSLGQIGARADLCVPALISVLTHEQMGVRYEVAISVGNFGPDAINAIPALEMTTKDVYGRVRVDAAMAIHKINPDAIDIVHFLIPELKDTSPPGGATFKVSELSKRNTSPIKAARALGELGELAIETIPLLIEMLDRENHYQRWAAVDGLAGIGPAASDALPKIKYLAENDPESAVREAAVEAIDLIEI